MSEVEVAPRESRPLVAVGWMLLACLLFALMSLAAKRAMRELPFLEVASGRAFFGAVWIWAFARWRGLSLEVRDKKSIMVWMAEVWNCALTLTRLLSPPPSHLLLSSYP
mgnify:CR=1 FL=1